jgi:CDP-diacylglycerol---glycerol-3-phosphate 3-phosphatidyltransferase
VRGALSGPDAGAVPPPSLINIANALTVLRLGLVPVFVVLLVSGGDVLRIAASVTFGLASATDFLDGELARRRSLITDFGKIADPIADKALTGSALVVLSALGELPWWVTGVILFRELAVTGLRFWVISHGVIAASRGGKIKTLLQVIAIALYILPGPFRIVREVVMGAALVVTVVTGADYVARAARLRRAAAGSPAGAGRPP